MTIIELRDTLFWCFIINIGLMLWWWIWLVAAHDWVYQMHTRWFAVSLSKGQFDAIHYAGIAFYKVLNILFFLVPWVALHIIAGG